MNVKIYPFIPCGEIIAPPSKSMAHRLLICSALKKGNTVIKNVGNSNDVITTAKCLNELGAKIRIQDGNAFVEGISQVKKGRILDCGESGSTLRFLIPVACALGADATFTGSAKLLSRPINVLVDEIKRHGVNADGLSFSGKLKSGEYEIDCSISSQFISGLLMALPYLDGSSELILKGESVSKGYVDLTISMLEQCGIKYEKSGNKFIIRGNQEYNLSSETYCEGDWSGASYPLVLGAMRGEVTVKGLNLDSVQGDKEILKILEKAGAEVLVKENGITVRKATLNCFEYNFDPIPDLAPVCSALASVAEGESVFSGISRLKDKESDRVYTTIKTLTIAGITAEEIDGKIKIKGGQVKDGSFDGENDHRIVMLATVLGISAEKESFILGADAVNKSYPDFFKDLERLGGKVDVDI